jgi:hypothetical protein
MAKRKDSQPDTSGTQQLKPRDDRPERPEPDSMEGPGKPRESKAEQDARNKTTRRGER